jgi:hypothetical protein
MVDVEKIIAELGANYNEADRNILEGIVERVTSVALSFSNRENTETNIWLLEPEIIECSKAVYLLRGTEDTAKKEQQGIIATYEDPYKKMTERLIHGHKRRVA